MAQNVQFSLTEITCEVRTQIKQKEEYRLK